MKVISKSKIKKKFWKLFSEYVRRRDGGKCFTCSTQKHWKKMDAGHYVPTSICGEYLHFDERNVNCQCTACNRYKHGNLTEYARRLVEKYGGDILKKLNQIKKESKAMSAVEMLKRIKRYEKKLRKLNDQDLSNL